MENQHRRITGYRELSQEEIDLMNEVKALGIAIEDALLKVTEHVKYQQAIAARDAVTSEDENVNRLAQATPERFAALAKTDFQTALMYLTRAVAQPTFF